MVWNILDDVTVGKFGEILLMQALPVKSFDKPHVILSSVVRNLYSLERRWICFILINSELYQFVVTFFFTTNNPLEARRRIRISPYSSRLFVTIGWVQCKASTFETTQLRRSQLDINFKTFDWLKPVNASLVRILHISLTNVLASQYWCGSIQLRLKVTIERKFFYKHCVH